MPESIAEQITRRRDTLTRTDGLLRFWVSLVEQGSFQIDITLVTGGTLVAGMMIPSEEYAEGLVGSFRDHIPGDAGDKLSAHLADLIKPPIEETSELLDDTEGRDEIPDDIEERDEIPDDVDELSDEGTPRLLEAEPLNIRLRDALTKPQIEGRDELSDDIGELSDEEMLQLLEAEPRYIHLRDARLMSGAGIIPTEGGIYWRGKIEAVDGWNFGRTSEARPD